MLKTRMDSPPKVPGNWLLGNLMQIKNEGVYFYPRIASMYGDVLRARIGWTNFYLFFHPDQIKEVLSEKSETYIKGDQYNQLRHLLGNGLLTSEGDDWEKQRRLLNPIFGKNGLDILLKHIQNTSMTFSSQLEIQKEINWSRKMFDYTLEVAITAFFGGNLEHAFLDQMAKDTHICMRFISSRMTNLVNPPLWIPLPEHKKFKKALANIKLEVEKIYDQKINATAQDQSKDLLDLLISSKDENQQKFSKTQIFDQVMSFLIAGHETTAVTLSWFFHLMAKNPLIQNSLIEELEKNNYSFNSSTDMINYPFLAAAINETMRLYPAGWIIARNSIKEDTLGGWKIKKKKIVAVCPYVAHRDARWWKDPDSFIPERFLDEEAMKNLPKGAFVPFSIGKRNCIGSRFALMEIMIFSIHFFKAYRISTTQDEVKVKGFVTLKTDRPILVTLQEARKFRTNE